MNKVTIVATGGSRVSNVTVGESKPTTLHDLTPRGLPRCATTWLRRLWFGWFGFVAAANPKRVTCPRCRP